MPPNAAKETGLVSFDWLDNVLVTELLDDATLLRLAPNEIFLVKIFLVRQLLRSEGFRQLLRKEVKVAVAKVAKRSTRKRRL